MSAFGSAAYWLARAEEERARYERALAPLGIRTGPELRIVDDPSDIYPRYDVDERHIALGLPDLTTASGRFRWLSYLRLLSVTSIEDAARAADDVLPLLVVHEMAHHLRHRHGRRDEQDPWAEEHAVNVLMVSYGRTRPDWPEVSARATRVLERMREGFARTCPLELVDATHDDLEEVLFHDLRLISLADYDRAFDEALRRGAPVLDVMLELGIATPAQLAQARARQQKGREYWNAVYCTDPAVYFYLHVQQLLVELVDRDLPDFARAHRTLVADLT